MITVSARPIPDRLKCRAERASTDECRADGIAFGRGKTERGVRGHGHIRGRLNDGLAGATRPGNHQRLLGSS